MYCGQCGTWMEGSGRKCPRCKTKAGKGKRFCRICGHPLDPKCGVCPGCGAVRNGKKEEAEFGGSGKQGSREGEEKRSASSEGSRQALNLPPIMEKILTHADMLEAMGNRQARKIPPREKPVTDAKEYLALYEKQERERKYRKQASAEREKREKRRKELIQLRRTGQISKEGQKELDALESGGAAKGKQPPPGSKTGRQPGSNAGSPKKSRHAVKRRFFLPHPKGKTELKAAGKKGKSGAEWRDASQIAGFVLSVCAAGEMFAPEQSAAALMAAYVGISLLLAAAGRKGQYGLLSKAAAGIDLYYAAAAAVPYLKQISSRGS